MHKCVKMMTTSQLNFRCYRCEKITEGKTRENVFEDVETVADMINPTFLVNRGERSELAVTSATSVEKAAKYRIGCHICNQRREGSKVQAMSTLTEGETIISEGEQSGIQRSFHDYERK